MNLLKIELHITADGAAPEKRPVLPGEYIIGRGAEADTHACGATRITGARKILPYPGGGPVKITPICVEPMKHLLCLLSLMTLTAQAGTRTSLNNTYTITADTTDAGGKRTVSASYTNDGSAGGIAGLSTAASPAETVKSGYAAQLYDVTGLTLTAATLNVNEGTTDQLAAWQLLDDATFLAVPAAGAAWSVAGGPLTGISAAGLATAAFVYQDTAATAQGVYLGLTGTLGLTVKNVGLDDFGAYAGDTIDDAWQVQYFGPPPNANAGPAVDFDGTGQTNLFKYIAGLNPLDPASRFTLSIQPVPGQTGQKNVVFTPRLTGRTYTVTSRPALTTGSYVPLTNPSAPSDAGPQRTITDLSAGGAAKFYRVEITKP